MAKIHMKGYMLQLLNRAGAGLWDHEIARRVLSEYGLSGAYWRGTVRVTLADLHSGGLIEELDEGLDDGRYFAEGRVLLKYGLTDFGLERMRDTGLA